MASWAAKARSAVDAVGAGVGAGVGVGASVGAGGEGVGELRWRGQVEPGEELSPRPERRGSLVRGARPDRRGHASARRLGDRPLDEPGLAGTRLTEEPQGRGTAGAGVGEQRRDGCAFPGTTHERTLAPAARGSLAGAPTRWSGWRIAGVLAPGILHPGLANRRCGPVRQPTAQDRRVLPEQGGLEVPDLRAGVEPELVVEQPAQPPDRVERLGLTTRPRERQCVQRPAALAQRVTDGGLLGEGQHGGVLPEGEEPEREVVTRRGAQALRARCARRGRRGGR